MVERLPLSPSVLCHRLPANAVASSAKSEVADLFPLLGLMTFAEPDGGKLHPYSRKHRDDYVYLARQCCIQVLQDIVDMFDAHGEPDAALCNPHRASFRRGQSAVRGDCWIAYLGEDIAQRCGGQAQT